MVKKALKKTESIKASLEGHQFKTQTFKLVILLLCSISSLDFLFLGGIWLAERPFSLSLVLWVLIKEVNTRVMWRDISSALIGWDWQTMVLFASLALQRQENLLDRDETLHSDVSTLWSFWSADVWKCCSNTWFKHSDHVTSAATGGIPAASMLAC